MFRSNKQYFSGFALIFLLFLPLHSLFAHENLSIQRPYQPVIIQGSQCPEFLTIPISELRVMRFQSGIWEPIPFQIDEKDGSWDYFGVKNGILDPKDEIAFMAQDLGEKADLTHWPLNKQAREHIRYEINYSDPLTSGESWVYVFHASTLDTSDVKYLSYDYTQDRVESSIYEIVHGSTGFQEHIFFRTSAGGDSIDILDRQKLRIQVEINFIIGTKTITIKENVETDIKILSVTVAHLSVRKGSVETIPSIPKVRFFRRMNLEIRITSPYIDNIEIDLPFDTYFSPYSAVWKTDSLEVEIEGYKIKLLRISNDLDPVSSGVMFYNPYNPGVLIDGVPSTVDKSLLWPGDNWYLITADPPASTIQNGSMVTILQLKLPPLSNSYELYFTDLGVPVSFGSDTGDRRSFGDTGIITTGDDINGDLDFTGTTYYFPFNMDTVQAKTVFNQHIIPLVSNIESQKLYFAVSTNSFPTNGGIIEVDPPGNIQPADTLVTFHAIPNSGFIFSHWSGDLAGTDPIQSLMMDTTKSVTAHFHPVREITVKTLPVPLSFSVDDTLRMSPQTFIWPENSVHKIETDSIQMVSDSRFRFNDWSNGGVRIQSYLVPGYPDTLTATFRRLFSLTTAVSPAGSGIITLTPEQDWYDENTYCRILADPTGPYVFARWTGDLSGSANPDSVFFIGPKSVTAVFGIPPVLDIPDTSFVEDNTLNLSFSEIAQWMTDPDDPDSMLIIQAQGQFLTAKWDSIFNRMQITSKMTDWNGQDTLFWLAVDPTGLSGRDTMLVEVLSDPDPPGNFSLLEPADHTIFASWPDTIHFLWETAVDPDSGDSVFYRFELDTTDQFSSPALFLMDSLQNSVYRYAWPLSTGDNTYYWRISARDKDSLETMSHTCFQFDLATDVNLPGDNVVPSTFILEQNIPNPFNNSTRIRFGAPESSELSLFIYNCHGQLVRHLYRRKSPPGFQTILWDGKNDAGKSVSTGVYLILLQTPSLKIVKKAVYIR